MNYFITNILHFLQRRILIIISIILFSFSFYFYRGAQEFKRKIYEKNNAAFKNGDEVSIFKIIDGDEISIINKKGKKTIVRVLGIKSFDNTSSTINLSTKFGTKCFEYLKKTYINKNAVLKIEKVKIDYKNRILAYLFIYNPVTKKFDIDLGLDLIKKGLSAVYIKYPFGKEFKYLKHEEFARQSKIGLWRDEHAINRVNALKELWKVHREK
jgi:endonuclease YncB( thermonuclease family)